MPKLASRFRKSREGGRERMIIKRRAGLGIHRIRSTGRLSNGALRPCRTSGPCRSFEQCVEANRSEFEEVPNEA